MAEFEGLWELQSSDENFEKYMEAAGVSQEKIELGKKFLTAGNKVRHDISKDGDTWVVKSISAAGEKIYRYPEGVETEVVTIDGRKVKTVYLLEGKELIELQKGSEFTSRNVRKVEGNQMTMSFTANDSITCKRVYTKVA